MKFAARFLIVLVALAVALPALADDQEKAQKEINKITSITADANMRATVNRTMAEMLNVKRLDLEKERQTANLTYGGIFLAHQLMASGAKLDDIAASIKSGKSIFDVANEQHANWKRINDAAKKMNKKIDENIEKYFQNTKKETEKNSADDYVVQDDRTQADANMSKQDLAEAQSRYQHLHDQAASQLPVGDANTVNAGAGIATQGAAPSAPVSSGGRH
jgi:hypothetical protein